MDLFELVKASVTIKQAAKHYGCKVNRGDMIAAHSTMTDIPA